MTYWRARAAVWQARDVIHVHHNGGDCLDGTVAAFGFLVLVVGIVYLLWASWDGYQREKGRRR